MGSNQENTMDRYDGDYKYLLEKAIDAQTKSAEALTLAARGMENQASTNKLQEIAFGKLSDQTERQTAALESMKTTVLGAQEFFKSWYFKVFLLLALLLFIAVGGGAIIREAKDSGLVHAIFG